MGRRKRKCKHDYVYNPPVPEYIYNSNFNLCIKNSNIPNGGLGVFTNEYIKQNEYLGNYTGEIKENERFTYGIYAVSLNSQYFIDAYEYPRTIFAMINDARFSEHSYNCEFKIFEDRAEVWSIKEIHIDEELYFDYGDEYWTYR